MSLWIKDWQKVFRLREAENHDQVTWTKFPVSRAGLSYRRLMSSSAGRTAYCVFVGCVRIVARGRTNGELIDKGRELTAKDLADETGIPVKTCQDSIELLKSAEIGWLTGPAPVSNRSENGSPPAQEQSRAEQIRKENTSASSESVGCAENGEGKNSLGQLPASQPATVREALERLRIGEPALSQLADSPRLSVPHVQAAWDEAQQGNPRDPRRVLVASLCRIAGVTLPRKRGSIGNSLASDPTVQRLIGIQRSRRMGAQNA